jgi:hypothetical protein
VTWYAAVEVMTGASLFDLLVHGDVVIRMCKVLTCWLSPTNEVVFDTTNADVRRKQAASSSSADVTRAVASSLGFGTAVEFLAEHRVMGLGRRAREGKLRIVPASACADGTCTACVVSRSGFALCAACAKRHGGGFRAHARSFAVRRGLLREVGPPGVVAPTLPVFVLPPGPYHLPDDVSAHILYCARLCKERHAARQCAAPTNALALGVVSVSVGALDAASFRPHLEELYRKLRLRRS